MPLSSIEILDARDLTDVSIQDLQAKNIPVVLKGLLYPWPASRSWSGDDGIKHLASLAGKASVQVMVSDGGLYRGDMEHRSSLTMTFQDFLSTADRLNNVKIGAQQLYLAQAPLQTSSSMESSLSPLLADISVPEFMQGQQVAHVNLWMCTRGSRSSLHYDPFHNLLCVVAGSKNVRCMSPAATQWLYPHPLYGESANHSAVDFAQPDLARHPLYKESLEHQLSAHLGAGDALFLPEGWWHQVDSEAVTIAVNFWWRSLFERQLGGHMDDYYLRRAAQSLTDARKADLLRQLSPDFHPCSSVDKHPAACVDARAAAATEVATSQAGPSTPASHSEEAADPAQHSAQKRSGHAARSGERESVAEEQSSMGEGRETQDGSRKRRQGTSEAAALVQSPQMRPGNAAGLSTGEEECLHIAAIGDEGAGQRETECGSRKRQRGTEHEDQRLVERLAAALSEEFLQRTAGEAEPPHDPAGSGDGLGLEAASVRLMAGLDSWQLRRALLGVARQFPRTLEAFLSGGICPAAAELLTSRFEAADAWLAQEGRHSEQQTFYTELYAVVEQPERVLQALVRQKEEFARHAFCMVLGTCFQLPIPWERT